MQFFLKMPNQIYIFFIIIFFNQVHWKGKYCNCNVLLWKWKWRDMAKYGDPYSECVLCI